MSSQGRSEGHSYGAPPVEGRVLGGKVDEEEKKRKREEEEEGPVFIPLRILWVRVMLAVMQAWRLPSVQSFCWDCRLAKRILLGLLPCLLNHELHMQVSQVLYVSKNGIYWTYFACGEKITWATLPGNSLDL